MLVRWLEESLVPSPLSAYSDNRSIASLSQYYQDGGIATPRHSTLAFNELGRGENFDPYASHKSTAGVPHRY